MSASGGRPNGDVGRWQLRLAAGSALVLTFFAGLALGWGLAGRRAASGPGWEGRGYQGGRASAGGRGGPREPGAPGRPRRDGGPGGPRGLAPFDDLDLTPVQRAAVDSIMAARRAQIDAFWRGDGQRLRQIIDSTGTDVRAILDPAQRATFDSVRERHRRREEGRRGGGGRPSFPAP